MRMKSDKIPFLIGIIVIVAFILGNAVMAMTNTNNPGNGSGSSEPQQVEAERIETETVTETIPYETKTVDDDTVDYGKTIVKTEGINGEKTYTYNVTYMGEKEISREPVKEEITKQPVAKVIANGTKIIWRCVDVTSYNKNPYDDNKCTSSTGEVRYVSDSQSLALDPSYSPGKSGHYYYNSK